jgi:hypothetical protein
MDAPPFAYARSAGIGSADRSAGVAMDSLMGSLLATREEARKAMREDGRGGGERRGLEGDW